MKFSCSLAFVLFGASSRVWPWRANSGAVRGHRDDRVHPCPTGVSSSLQMRMLSRCGRRATQTQRRRSRPQLPRRQRRSRRSGRRPKSRSSSSKRHPLSCRRLRRSRGGASLWQSSARNPRRRRPEHMRRRSCRHLRPATRINRQQRAVCQGRHRDRHYLRGRHLRPSAEINSH